MRTRTTFVFSALLVFALTAAFAQGQPEAPRHDFPPVGRYQVLTADFHMHTLNSDGKPTTRQRVEESYRLGYDVIAVTDHGTTRAYRVAKYVGEKLGMVVINGIETGIKGKEHMNAFGMSTEYVPSNSHNWAEEPGQSTVYYRDEMQKIARLGGVIIYNHPHVGYREPLEWGVKQGCIIGIEVKNDVVGSKWKTTEWNGIYCYPDAFDFALKHNLALFANTDVHGTRNSNPSKTLLLVEERSPEGVMEAIRARRTAAWFEGVVWGREGVLADLVKACVSAKRASDGRLSLDNKGPITLKARIEGSGAVVELPAYQAACVEVPGTGKSVRVTWENLWTGPSANLSTIVRLGG